MAKTSKAHLFSVIPEGGNAEDIEALLRRFVSKTKFLRFESKGISYLVTDALFRSVKKKEFFTASVFKLQSSEFPSVVDDREVKPLSLADNHELGEPMCFAYDPVDRRAVIQSVGTGPRPSILRSFLEEIGFDFYVNVDPLVRRDIIERLNKTRIFRSIVVKLLKPAGEDDSLRGIGKAAAGALDAMDEFGANVIQMDVSLRNGRGELYRDKVLRYVTGLLRFRDTNLKSLKVGVLEEDDLKTRMVDILGGRFEYLVELKPVGREWDRAFCQKQLAAILEDPDREISKAGNA